MLAARPEVFNHNIETVRRLHARMRGAKASYDGALRAARPRARTLAGYPLLTKSGIIVGLGERNDEVVETLRDLRRYGVDVVTIGQYLQPSARHAPIDRWVHPDEFDWFRRAGRGARVRGGVRGPLVRSSYRADEQRAAASRARSGGDRVSVAGTRGAASRVRGSRAPRRASPRRRRPRARPRAATGLSRPPP